MTHLDVAEREMVEIHEIEVAGFEKVIEGFDPKSGLHCFIAIHDTTLGPALGGTRFYPYATREAALHDVLGLARAMTYKSALARTGLGGGKSVIIAPPSGKKSEALLASFAEVINALGGLYIAAEDVGTTAEDMALIHRTTPYVAALPEEGSSGDPSPFTAYGVFVGIEAVAEWLWGSSSLEGKRVLIQGVGSVGSRLVHHLFWAGADLIVADIDEERCRRCRRRYGAQVIHDSELFSTPCDIFAPCALSEILDKKSVSQLQAAAVAGAANTQLKEAAVDALLMERGILYAPDYVINAGGVINAATEFDPEGYDPRRVRTKVVALRKILLDLFSKAAARKMPTGVIADEIALYNLHHGIGKRKEPLRMRL